MNDFLFELGVEELPVAAVQELSQALLERFRSALQEANIPHGELRGFGSPRRLAILAKGVASTQASQMVTRRGPTVTTPKDEPGPAVLGFAKSCGVTVAELQIQETDKGAWWIYTTHTPEIPTARLLPAVIQRIVIDLPIKKLMRWGEGDLSFSRPVHWAMLLWGHEIIETEILGVRSGRTSYGHRFHHPGPISITTPTDYESALVAAYVIPDFNQRRDRIRTQMLQLAAEHQLEVVIPQDLLDEVTAIVEWPRALLANFDEKFLTIPAEALIAAMQVHQKSFALYTRDGQIAPHFIAVANIESSDTLQVKKGNEKVMHARLSDAAFFYQKDQQQGLSSHCRALHQVVFQSQLGSLADKSARIAQIMSVLQVPLQLNPADLQRSAELCKCDLLTGMVGEFPELQGIMGYHYARDAQESAAVALALKEQYLPRFSQDELPASSLGYALSLADRLDTLYGLFAIGQKPTGVKDPFKLRRHALAIARMLTQLSNEGLRVRVCLQAAADAYVGHLNATPAALIDELQSFILDRLQSYYQNQGVPVEVFQAVRACQTDHLYDMQQRIAVLVDFIQAPQALALIAMAKRVNNVLTQAPKEQKTWSVDPVLLVDHSEQHLWSGVAQVAQRFATHPSDYTENLQALVRLQPLLAEFFEQVMVMDPNPSLQKNRIALLSHLQRLLTHFADLSQLASLTSGRL